MDALHWRALPHIFREPSGSVRDRAYMLGLMADEGTALLVIQIEERVVGFIHVKLWDVPSIFILVPRRVAMMDNLAVSEGVRRKGVGRALMERTGGENLRPDQ